MIDTFRTMARTLNNPFVEKWKGSGGKVIGFPCTYLPEEIIHAAGMLPFRFRGVGTTSLSVGDTYFGPVICSFPKCILQLAGEGRYEFLDGAVIVPGCDSMRRLDECWRKAGEDYQGSLPGYFHYFGVPHKVTDYSISWFEEETVIFKESLEQYFDLTITDDAVAEAIGLYNGIRRLLCRMDRLRTGDTVLLSGSDALAVLVAGSAMPRGSYRELLEGTLDSLEREARDISEGRKRLMLVGSVNDDVGFMDVIEDSGGLIVADTLCFGFRSYADLVDESDEPLKALTRRYLQHSYCPRMFGYYKDRLQVLRRRIREARVDGVILQNIRFCDLHGSENGIFERDLEAEGVPCMRIEREYGPLVETGRLKMRIDAFMERLG
ncbi:MAG: 2-hydroxyacyl-CoA dehydratase [Deltaproteobacteria bacterium]|nr:2-hydroxyacyl-CoA dehydratase [Deltaproteobacteria bacterium]